jgi:glutathione S-transferase
MTITVYHLETSRSERIVWLMEELGIPYELRVFPRETTGAAPHPLKEIHPLGRAPVIRDGHTVLAESGAIVDYIVHRHGGGRLALLPDDPVYAKRYRARRRAVVRRRRIHGRRRHDGVPLHDAAEFPYLRSRSIRQRRRVPGARRSSSGVQEGDIARGSDPKSRVTRIQALVACALTPRVSRLQPILDQQHHVG